MAVFVVDTLDDVVDAEDGRLSLREAVARANASSAADSIRFDPGLAADGPALLTLSDGPLELEGTLAISGDMDDDGLADLYVLAEQGHHATVASGAAVTLIGMDFFGGSAERSGGQADAGTDGADGTDQPRAFGERDFSFLDQDGDLEVAARGGVDGDDGATGGAGEAGTDGADGLDQAAAIVNFGSLALMRVGFGSNVAFGEAGGNGGRGGQGGAGGQGGDGFRGDSTLIRNGEYDPFDPRGNEVVDGGDGGDGGAGGRGGDGGGGGDGSDVAGAVLNGLGASLVLTDVAFGGSLSTGLVFGGNVAFGGAGGAPGAGGFGGNGGTGGDGGDGASLLDLSSPPERGDPGILNRAEAGDAGDGGDGGRSGGGGDAGAYGDGGAAAGAILNLGTVSGGAAFFGNAGGGATARPEDRSLLEGPGAVAGTPGGAGEQGQRGGWSLGDGRRDEGAFGEDGVDGLRGPQGAGRREGAAGTARDTILNLGSGGDTVAESTVLVFAHGVRTAGSEAAPDGALAFNLIRLGAAAPEIAIEWEIRAAGGRPVTGADFAGGVLPSGTATLPGVADIADAARADAFRTVEIDLVSDGLSEGAETFEFAITAATIPGGGAVAVGTDRVAGSVSDDGDGGGNGDGGGGGPVPGRTVTGGSGNERLAGGEGDDLIVGGGGIDRVTGGGGADTFVLFGPDSPPGLIVSDFSQAEGDRLAIDDRLLGLGGAGIDVRALSLPQAAALLREGTVAYDPSRGLLTLDPDGDGTPDGGALLGAGVVLGIDDVVIF